jgi:hypothetical protein
MASPAFWMVVVPLHDAVSLLEFERSRQETVVAYLLPGWLQPEPVRDIEEPLDGGADNCVSMAVSDVFGGEKRYQDGVYDNFSACEDGWTHVGSIKATMSKLLGRLDKAMWVGRSHNGCVLSEWKESKG